MKPTAVEWFQYDTISFGDGMAWPAPLLPVVFESAGRVQVAYGIVDSGSGISCIPAPVARALGCSISEPAEDISVFGAKIKARKAVVNMRIATSSGVLSFDGIECWVPLSDEGVNVAVLGRHPLFGEVEVRFQDWLHRFGLQRRRAFLPGGGGAQPPPFGAASLTALRTDVAKMVVKSGMAPAPHKS